MARPRSRGDKKSNSSTQQRDVDLAARTVCEIYDALAEDYAQNYESGNPDKPFLDEFLSHLQKAARLLDLGCGTGSSSKYFFEHGMRVEGLDLSPKMIELASRRFPEIRFRTADLRHLTVATGQLEAVWAGYCLFHVKRQEFKGVIAEIRRWLVFDGVFGLTMQEGAGVIDSPEALLPGKALPVCLYSAEELKAVLRANNFEVITDKKRRPVSELEYPYDKLLLVARAIGKPAASASGG
jgi:SAM-dependent methyltransferase